MFVFHSNETYVNLEDFGILVPLKASRGEMVIHFLERRGKEKSWRAFVSPEPLTRDDLCLVHSAEYVDALFSESCSKKIEETYELIDEKGNFNRYDPSLAKRSLNEIRDIVLKEAGTSYLTMVASLKNKFAYFLGGGMHHAMSFGGRGFCLVNDIVIGLKKLQHEKKIKSAWVIDVDAHKGDGTAELTKNDESIRTLSIHMKKGWPLDGTCLPSDPYMIPSDLDIEIGEGEEKRYLPLLKKGLDTFLERYPRPDIVIVVNGSDPYEYDELPSASLLKLTKEELLERDQMLFDFFHDRGIPQTYLLAGGYGDRVYEIHLQFLESVLDKLVGK